MKYLGLRIDRGEYFGLDRIHRFDRRAFIVRRFSFIFLPEFWKILQFSEIKGRRVTFTLPGLSWPTGLPLPACQPRHPVCCRRRRRRRRPSSPLSSPSTPLFRVPSPPRPAERFESLLFTHSLSPPTLPAATCNQRTRIKPEFQATVYLNSTTSRHAESSVRKFLLR